MTSRPARRAPRLALVVGRRRGAPPRTRRVRTFDFPRETATPQQQPPRLALANGTVIMRDTTGREPDMQSVLEQADRRSDLPDSAAALREKWRREHARRTWAFNVIREHIAAQPTPSSMRAVCRLWCRDLTLTADALAQARQDQEHDQ